MDNAKNNSIYMVYHYCTVDTFKKIMKSKVLWLSDLTNSNDDQEVVRTFVNLWEGVKTRLKKTDLSKELLSQTIRLVDEQYKIELMTDPPYGICFCKEDDLLTQWIEYGDKTRGLSLGFDINWFIKNGIKQQMPHPNIIQSSAIGCNDVIYHSEKLEKEMAEICYQELKQQGPRAWITLIRPTFKHYSGFVKNPTFEVESEIRIVYYPTKGHEVLLKDIDVSELKMNDKKHYEIPWLGMDSQALKSICIGHNCVLTKEEIINELKKNNINTEVKIIESKCSYRPRD